MSRKGETRGIRVTRGGGGDVVRVIGALDHSMSGEVISNSSFSFVDRGIKSGLRHGWRSETWGP